MRPILRPLIFLATLLAAAGCVTPGLGSSAIRTGPGLPPSSAPVDLSVTRDVADARELGLVEAWGTQPIELDTLASRFRERVAELGGDRGRVDRFWTAYELVPFREERECGGQETHDETRVVTVTGPDGALTTRTETVQVSAYVSRTCTVEGTREVATLRLAGRALRAPTSSAAPVLEGAAAGGLAHVSVTHAFTRAAGLAPSDPVKVVFEGSPGPAAYEEVALVSARTAMSPGDSTLPLVGELQARAATLGCDAVLAVRIDRGGESTTATGVAVRLR